MTQDRDHSENDIALAGEYALHLLDAESRLAFETRLAQDTALQQLVREWDEDFVSFSEGFAPVTPPARMKSQIDARLFGPEKSGFSLQGLFGRRFAYLAFASLAALAIIAGPVVFNTATAPEYVAEIAGEDRSLVVAAAYDQETAELSINRTAGAAIAGRSLELWLIAEGATAPVSLGVLSDAQLATVIIPEDLRDLMLGGTLAISDEPIGGSPTGAPTGAVLAAGEIISS
ncbi:anti-sigma-K factor RskA [Pacificibacter maritimus]|uniref:Regulator of SigK n=1 Tax=Pacificibacter maritimus TaxID=762213 RepID=A0A3N4UGZ6_9RHOB|nr:anti-sigma factor [Pacificibacter maritimus]RPE66439.1 anti-sigma-K factor RskA [Pacificibacter maritimus]